jgi:AsmA-like C-terminal region
VAVSLRHDGAYWDRVLIDATLPEGQALTVRYQPEAGKHKLSVTSGDAGGVLRAFDIIDNVKGGALNVVGEATDFAPGRPLVGQAVINDFRLVRAPVLARLLTLATLTGFVDALTGEGFQFNQFKSDFTKTGGRLDIKLARAHGPSIGLTGSGNADFDANTVDINGTVVPAYALNSILGNIPVIGDLLQGGKGEGMFAATYHASGSLDEPRISVNPLAALTPGFLRGLFDIFSGSGDSGGEDGATPDAPPAPSGTNK